MQNILIFRKKIGRKYTLRLDPRTLFQTIVNRRISFSFLDEFKLFIDVYKNLIF